MSQRILVIEDDQTVAELIRSAMSELGLEVQLVADGATGLKRALTESFDLVVLDLVLPKLHGLEVCRSLRHQRPALPILMLTCRADEADRVVGLELGANDYLVKPFSMRELTARVRSMLKLVHALAADARGYADRTLRLVFPTVLIEIDQRRVIVRGQPIDLTVTEFDILLYLALRAGSPQTREAIARGIGADSAGVAGGNMTSHISRLRDKIELDPATPKLVRTVWGVGYVFHDAPAADA